MLKGKKLYEFDEHYRIIITLSVRADPPFLIYDPWINKERNVWSEEQKKLWNKYRYYSCYPWMNFSFITIRHYYVSISSTIPLKI